MEKAIQRWIVDISNWDPSPTDFTYALSFLPPCEHSSVTRFVRLEDRKRALTSRLLQYALVHEVLEIPYDEIVIKRTLEGKPYLESDEIGLQFPNFNFNTTHHGDYVAIASEPLCLVGLDIVSHSIPYEESAQEFVQNFSTYFSRLEWNSIIDAGTSDEILGEFYRYWSLKESYVKAVGSGMGSWIDEVEFHHNNWANISVKINGIPMTEWKFWLLELDKKHWASIARGPPRSAVKSYKMTLRKDNFKKDEYHMALHLPNLNFVFRTVEQLFPVLHREI